MKPMILFYLGCCVLFCSCAKPQQTVMKKPVLSQSSPRPKKLPPLGPVRAVPPPAAEVEGALVRIFGQAVAGDREQRWFCTGDFNGDGSQDLVAIVTVPKSQLATINDSLANWTIQDARAAFIPPAHARVVKMPPKPRPQRVHEGEVLLAIIHGYGRGGWRDPQARQAYLVRHAGTAPLHAVPAPAHVEGALASLFHSDVIFTASERNGFVFWTGSQYAWRPAITEQVLAKMNSAP